MFLQTTLPLAALLENARPNVIEVRFVCHFFWIKDQNQMKLLLLNCIA